jgi:20S proteasome alpha/beta subunit
VYNQNFEKQMIFNNWGIIKPSMTFILGSRCVDGVVLVADRKITSKDQVESITCSYKDKIFGFIRHAIFACAGSNYTFEFFRDYIVDRVKNTTDITYDNAPLKLADIALDINKKRDYDPTASFELLVAIQYPDNRPSSLTWITKQGASIPMTKYHSIGIGAIYVKPFMQELWHAKMSMEEAAELGWLCIKYIEHFRLHSSVGVGKFAPQIWFIPNDERNEKGEKKDYQLNAKTKPEVFAKIKRNTTTTFNKYMTGIKSLK